MSFTAEASSNAPQENALGARPRPSGTQTEGPGSLQATVSLSLGHQRPKGNPQQGLTPGAEACFRLTRRATRVLPEQGQAMGEAES